MRKGIKLAGRITELRLKETDMPSEAEWSRYFRPRKTLLRLGLGRGMVFADLGCGYGTFSLAGSRIVGKSGKVYAIDVDRKVITRLRRRASENLVPILGDISRPERIPVPAHSMDFCLLANVIHGAKDRVGLLKGVRRSITSVKQIMPSLK